MNFKIQKIVLGFFLFPSIGVFYQIKEEQLIINKKREPEVKKIDKKKTSVEIIKNYPPEEKSQIPVEYCIKNVPALSDFQTSTLQADDVSPEMNTDYLNNYVQFGLGNYSKILADANISYTLENKLQVGGDAHLISTHGLKEIYPWDSRQNGVKIGGFLNGYLDQGKFNINADFGQEKYNYYGIYDLQPASDININQKVNTIRINGYYDHFSNEFLNDVRLKTSFLSDHFGASENSGSIDFNFSKHAIELALNDVFLNADMGLNLATTNTKFNLLSQNTSKYFQGNLTPKFTFSKGNSYLMIGSGFNFLNAKQANNIDSENSNKTYWFPRAEIQLSANERFNFYTGIDGGLELNSYANMLKENPYLVSNQNIKPTETKFKVYFGLRGDIDEIIKYDVSAGYSKMNNIMFFQSNELFDKTINADRSAYDFANTFSTVYDNGSKDEVKLSLQYFPLENLSLDGEINYISFKLENYDNIYNIPLVKANIGAKYTMLDKKLLLGFQAFLASDTKVNTFSISNDGISSSYNIAENKDEKLNGRADINLSAEYIIHKNFSIFALGNNLLGAKYSTFQAYQVLGTQILGGLKIIF
jgi:hypothetical protein